MMQILRKIFNQSELIKLAIFLVIFILILFIFILPFINLVNNFYDKLAREEKQLAAKYKSGDSFAKTKEDYQALADKIPPYQDLFSPSGQELKLITTLEKLAKTHNLTQKLNLNPTKISYSDQLEALSLELELKGSFNDLIFYLEELSKYNFKLNVSAVNLKQISQDLLEIRLLTNAYWLKQF